MRSLLVLLTMVCMLCGASITVLCADEFRAALRRRMPLALLVPELSAARKDAETLRA